MQLMQITAKSPTKEHRLPQLEQRFGRAECHAVFEGH